MMEEFSGREGEIVSGIVQKVERGVVIVDFHRATGILAREEQIFGERFMQGQRIRAYLLAVEETPRGVNLELSRSHPRFLESLFAIESPEISSGVVEIKAIAREAGSRSKIAVFSNDPNIDPIGACVGQRGVRVSTVMNELAGEKIDIIEWSDNMQDFVAASLSPAKIQNIEIKEEEKVASIEVASDQLSLAIGKGGQNVRLAAKLTGYRIDIKGDGTEKEETEEAENVSIEEISSDTEETTDAPEATNEEITN
jgi:N utilization substance protein A